MPRRKPRALPPLSVRDVVRFWSKVDRSGGPEACWPWTSARTAGGYGVMSIRQVVFFAHRLAVFLATASDPGEHHVLHACDNPRCVNPAHLSLGTHDDNMADASVRGRFPIGPRASALRCGERNGQAKLTERAVLDVRRRAAAGEPYTEIAKRFAVSGDAIGLCVRGRTWKHVREVSPCA